jgi:hypothetical protein
MVNIVMGKSRVADPYPDVWDRIRVLTNDLINMFSVNKYHKKCIKTMSFKFLLHESAL